MDRRRVLLASLALVTAGCDDGSDPEHNGLRRFEVAAREVLSQSAALAIPSGAAVVGEHLVVLDAASDSVIHILDRTAGTLLLSYGRNGEGPGEFRMAWSVDAPSPDGIWVYDPVLSRTTYLNLQELLRSPDSVVPTILNLEAEAALFGPLWMREGWMLSPALLPENRLAKLDSNGVMFEKVGPPPAGDPRIPTSVRHTMHQGIPNANPRHDRLVLGSRYLPRIEIFDSHGSLLLTAQVPVEWDLRSRDLSTLETFVVTPEVRMGYLAVAPADELLFALFSGRSDSSGKTKSLGEYVHIFDWSGRFLGYLVLAVEAVAIAVDPGATVLYALEQDPVPAVSAYELVGLRSERDE